MEPRSGAKVPESECRVVTSLRLTWKPSNLASGHGDGCGELIDPLQVGNAGGQQQQESGGHLQAIGQPGQAQRPAKGHLHVGQLLRPQLPLQLLQGLLGVADVDAHPRQGEETWGNKPQQTETNTEFSKC
ncbi:hypothetical protein JZ751_027564 [Albula glossodonta]|uniref:Uncharacterized protein n=1 Tax=Albula glossodonta TaxID=121402 RepID=A0A8T2NG49_9TELE|nr:hypothetical protein JZ751_027564 [Albula glossodonta]